MYDVDYFIKKFQAIPEKFWNDYTQTGYSDDRVTHCAFGHCQTSGQWPGNEDGSITPEGQALCEIFNSVGMVVGSGKWITSINNGNVNEYPQPTPKQRILAALHDIKKMQAPVKQRIVYVAETLREQVKEVGTN